MKIAQIRQAIDTLNWNRHDATGGTPDENQRTDLPARLAPHIDAVKALQIAPRFARDLQNQESSLQYANTVIVRWHDKKNSHNA